VEHAADQDKKRGDNDADQRGGADKADGVEGNGGLDPPGSSGQALFESFHAGFAFSLVCSALFLYCNKEASRCKVGNTQQKRE